MANGGHPGERPWDPERTKSRRAGTIAGHKGGSTLRAWNPVEVAKAVVGTSGRKGLEAWRASGKGARVKISVHSPQCPNGPTCPQTQGLPSGGKD